jgi:mono/diheme cytochrome c family protein
MIRKTAATLCLILAATAVRAEGFLPYDDPVAVAEGERLYGTYCASCHGADLEGEPNWRDRDADGYLPAPPHDPEGHTWHHPDAQLFAITKHGTAALVGDGYKSRMLGFGDVLSDIEIVQTLAYIKSRWPQRVIDLHNQVNAR